MCNKYFNFVALENKCTQQAFCYILYYFSPTVMLDAQCNQNGFAAVGFVYIGAQWGRHTISDELFFSFPQQSP